VVSPEQTTSAPRAEALTPQEQTLLAHLRRFKEAKRHPKWSTQLGDTWDEYLVRFVRRLHQSNLDAILLTTTNRAKQDVA
jgi:hypothetical protein